MTTATTEIERPTQVYAEYWPAAVLMPDGTTRRNCRVYLTDTGIHIFYTKPKDELAPGFTAAIDFEATPAPNVHARNVGVDVVIERPCPPEDGDPIQTLVITPVGGCGCGNTLKTWRPTWSHEIYPWPAS